MKKVKMFCQMFIVVFVMLALLFAAIIGIGEILGLLRVGLTAVFGHEVATMAIVAIVAAAVISLALTLSSEAN